jgi:DNA-binding response OmpR family regulator
MTAMPSNKCRILCIDDNDDTCFMLLSLLQPHGYEVATVCTTTEGLQLACDEDFDLYILDNIFPDGSGTDLCQRLREMAPEKPIIMYSGAAYEIDRRKGLRAGATAYIAKPEIDGLTNSVNELLADKKCLALGVV